MRFACFPLAPDIEVLLRHKELMGAGYISQVISFREDGEKLRALEAATGIPCTTSVEKGLDQADALLLFDNTLNLRWDKYYSCIDLARIRGIPIFASRRFISLIEDQTRQAQLEPIESVPDLRLTYMDERLYEIKTPIITVMGLGENCGKFECQLEFKEQLDAGGYHSEWISSNPLGACVGMHTLPDLLFDENISFPGKVYALNRYVYDLCASYKPDVLVLGVPGGIVSLADKTTNFFSEIPLIVTAALHVDFSILTFYYRSAVYDDYLDRLTRYCLHRYQTRVPIFYMARQMMVYNEEHSKMQQLFLSDTYIAEHPGNLRRNKNVAVPLKNNAPVFQSLILRLQENFETV